MVVRNNLVGIIGWLKRVPDDHYVAMPNQFGIDNFDLEDALTSKKNHMCSSDMKEFIAKILSRSFFKF